MASLRWDMGLSPRTSPVTMKEALRFLHILLCLLHHKDPAIDAGVHVASVAMLGMLHDLQEFFGNI